LWWLLRRVGRFSPWTAVLFPLPLLFFLAIFLRSLIATFVTRSVRWKGRRLAAGRH
jgi:4,4'-diaponeurosporenoate glycosyltransferase